MAGLSRRVVLNGMEKAREQMGLDMEEVSCASCGSAELSVLYERKSSQDAPEAYIPSTDVFSNYGRVVKCSQCGLVRLSPRPKWNFLLPMYQSTDDSLYLDEALGRSWSAWSILRRVERVAGTGRLLDVGCGPGVLLSVAKNRWDAVGVEVSKRAAEEARKRFNAKVVEGTLEQASFPAESFDAVTMVDVIEHLPNPGASLHEASRILKPGGVLFVLTPNIDAPVAKMMGRWWWGFRPAHLNYFSRKTMDQMLVNAGFYPLTSWYCGRTFSFGYWLSRLRGYAPWLVSILMRIASLTRVGRIPVYLNTFDSIGILSIKQKTGEDRAKPVNKKGKKVVAVLPAYNAEKTLERTLADIPPGLFDDIILVDDASRDGTVALAKKLGLKVFVHPKNRGYGGNQKTCYSEAMALGADIMVMLHPDFQYDPRLAPDLVEPLVEGRADCVLGSRLLRDEALKGRMPLWKYVANKFLTGLENMGFGTRFSEYHTGYRSYTRQVLNRIRLDLNNDGFVFDQQIIAQLLLAGATISEIPIPTRYFKEASSVAFWPSVKYGLQTLGVIARYRLHRHGILKFPQYVVAPPPPKE